MLLLCHLFIGTVIGLILLDRSGKRAALIAGIIGALLPDLIDKPIGHLILQNIDNGRLFSHTLIFLVVLIAIFYVLREKRYGILLFGLVLGTASHHLTDSLFMELDIWLWPSLGPFPTGHYGDYFSEALFWEATSPSEWIFGVASLALILAALERGRWSLTSERFKNMVDRVVIILFVSALAMVFIGIFTLTDSRWNVIPVEYMAALVMSAGAFALAIEIK